MMIEVGTNIIETERLFLRRFGYEDSTSMLAKDITRLP